MFTCVVFRAAVFLLFKAGLALELPHDPTRLLSERTEVYFCRSVASEPTGSQSDRNLSDLPDMLAELKLHLDA